MGKDNCKENKGGDKETESKSTEINNVTSDSHWLVNQRLLSALHKVGLSQLWSLHHSH